MSSNQNFVTTYIAAEAITEFALVSINAAGKIVITTAGTDAACVGVAQRAGVAGDAIDVVVFGLTRVIAGGNIAFETETRLAAAAAGKMVPAVALDYPTARCQANINQVSAVAGDQITVLFHGPASIF